MDWTERSKTAPTLNVFAPTSQRAAVRPRQLPKSFSARPDAEGRPTGRPLIVADDAGNLIDVGNSQRAAKVTIVLDPGLTSTPRDLPEQGPRQFSLRDLIRGIPSWLISLCVHLVLILTLAVSTFGVAGSRQVELKFVEAPADFESAHAEIEFDVIEVEDEQELLELDPAQTEIALNEVIPLEVMEAFSGVIEEDISTEIGDFIGMPGSTTSGPTASGAAAKHSGDKGKSARFFGTESYGSKFVFVIDCSKSMKGSRWYHAVKELNDAIDGLDESQEFLVLLYNQGTYVMLGIPKAAAALVVATDANKDLFRRWLRKQRPNGGTFPAKAMYRALELSPDAVFMLSDGELQDNTRRLLQTWNPEQTHDDGTYGKIPIHTISLGKKGQGQRMMRSIAHQNDGRFTWIQ